MQQPKSSDQNFQNLLKITFGNVPVAFSFLFFEKNPQTNKLMNWTDF